MYTLPTTSFAAMDQEMWKATDAVQDLKHELYFEIP
jgi:hypothetical protein